MLLRRVQVLEAGQRRINLGSGPDSDRGAVPGGHGSRLWVPRWQVTSGFSISCRRVSSRFAPYLASRSGPLVGRSVVAVGTSMQSLLDQTAGMKDAVDADLSCNFGTRLQKTSRPA